MLPPKKTPQEWVDDPLPGLEPDPKQDRQKSRKDEDDDAHKITYRRYHGARSIVCHDCAYEGSSQNGEPYAALGPRSATHVRTYQGMDRYLCGQHTQMRRDRDMLDKKGTA